jgi:RecB family exonuclease
MEIGKFASAKKAVCDTCKSNDCGPAEPEQPTVAQPEQPATPPTIEPTGTGATAECGLQIPADKPRMSTLPWIGASGEWVVPDGYEGPVPPLSWSERTVGILIEGDEQDVPRETSQAIVEMVATALDKAATDAVAEASGDETPQNSMRASRDAKTANAKPFKPEPFFLRQSMISSYMQCPDKFYETYENGYNEETIFTKMGTAIHGIMEDFYNGNPDVVYTLFDKWWTQHAPAEWNFYAEWRELIKRYFDRLDYKQKPNVIATELEFQIIINGVPCSGTIDRIDRVDEKTIKIVDYKTNMRAWTKDELDNNIQMSFYGLAAEQLKHVLGEFENIEFVYDMMRLGYEQKATRTREQLDMFAEWIPVIWEKILSGGDRKPKLNQYCAFCQRRATCSLYQSVLENKYQPIITETTNMARLDEEREELTKIAKVIDKRLGEINDQLKEAIVQNGGVAEAGDYEYRTVSQSMYTYPAVDVARIFAMNGMGDRFMDVVSIGSTKLKDLLKGNKELFEKVEAVKVQGYKAPSLTRSKKKGVVIVDDAE